MLHIQARHHRHVDPGVEGQARGVAAVLGEAVGHQFLLGGVVRDHEALEAPLPAQDVGQQFAAARRRHAVHIVEGAHDRQGAGVHRRLERRQEHAAQRLLAHVGGVVFDPAHGGGIGGHVFGGGQDRVTVVQTLFALEAAHAGGGQQVVQQHVLARALDVSAPALVARHVHHRRIGLVHGRGRRLHRRRACGPVGQFGVERRRLGQGHGEDGRQAVDHVGGEQQRDLQPAFLHRHLLDATARLGADAVEQRPDLALADQGGDARGIARAVQRVHRRRHPPERIGQQVQLAGLFLDRHGRDQILDPLAVTGDGAGRLGGNRHGEDSGAHQGQKPQARQEISTGSRRLERSRHLGWRSFRGTIEQRSERPSLSAPTASTPAYHVNRCNAPLRGQGRFQRRGRHGRRCSVVIPGLSAAKNPEPRATFATPKASRAG